MPFRAAHFLSGADAGKILIVHGASSNTTSLYDPDAGSMSAGPALPVSPGGAMFVPLP